MTYSALILPFKFTRNDQRWNRSRSAAKMILKKTFVAESHNRPCADDANTIKWRLVAAAIAAAVLLALPPLPALMELVG